MFRDDQQSARACRALLITGQLQDLWTDAGPIPRARELVETSDGLSDAQRLLLLAAFALWDGRDPSRLAGLVDVLDVQQGGALRSLLAAVAAGTDAIDAWLTRHERPGV